MFKPSSVFSVTTLLGSALLGSVLLGSVLAAGPQVPIDFGGIAWGVDFEAARKVAATSKKPLLVVFR